MTNRNVFRFAVTWGWEYNDRDIIFWFKPVVLNQEDLEITRDNDLKQSIKNKALKQSFKKE